MMMTYCWLTVYIAYRGFYELGGPEQSITVQWIEHFQRLELHDRNSGVRSTTQIKS